MRNDPEARAREIAARFAEEVTSYERRTSDCVQFTRLLIRCAEQILLPLKAHVRRDEMAWQDDKGFWHTLVISFYCQQSLVLRLHVDDNVVRLRGSLRIIEPSDKWRKCEITVLPDESLQALSWALALLVDNDAAPPFDTDAKRGCSWRKAAHYLWSTRARSAYDRTRAVSDLFVLVRTLEKGGSDYYQALQAGVYSLGPKLQGGLLCRDEVLGILHRTAQRAGKDEKKTESVARVALIDAGAWEVRDAE